MIEKITKLIEKNWDSLPFKYPLNNKESLIVTKFCQRIVGQNTKVLFLVTCQEKPICIIKTIRDVRFNEKLKKEKEAQEKIKGSSVVVVPRVYFDGIMDGRYLYAEEVVLGKLISSRLAKKNEGEIVKMIQSFPVYGNISSKKLVDIFSECIPEEDSRLPVFIKYINGVDVVLKKGLTHSDFARPNIMVNFNKLYVIDWERAGERPIWLIDAVYFMVKLRGIRNIEEWNKKASPVFIRYTGVNTDTATALYCIHVVLEIFRKKYPERYNVVISRLRDK